MTTNYETWSQQDLIEKIEGLESDLSDAISVALSRGAIEWATLNYSNHPKVREIMNGTNPHIPDMALIMKVARAVARRERAACLHAVGGAWAKIEGTPYYAGPRKFCLAIENLPDVSETSLKQVQEDIL